MAEDIVAALSDIPESERRFSDLAILYRAHGHREEFIAALEGQNIPYKVVGVAGFHGKEEIKGNCAMVNYASGREDGVSLHRVLSLADWSIPSGELTALSCWMNTEG